MVATAVAFAAFSAFLLAAVNCQQDGSIRLYNGYYSSDLTTGVVEVYYNSQWSTICGYNSNGLLTWGYNEATVACQQLGLSGALSYSSSSNSNTPLGFYGVDCSSPNYLVLLQCNNNQGTVGVCSDSDRVTVSCSSSLLTSLPYTGMVRLVGGSDVTTGRAEVYCNNQWGTLCSTGFTTSVLQTVCKQLGYNDYQTYDVGANPGPSDEPIWLSNYVCSVGYSCISSCQTCPATSSSTCTHSQDVSVTCKYDIDLANYGSSLYTCNYDLFTPWVIAGIVIGSIALFAFCVCLWVGVPMCICCCLGIGIGAATKHHHYDRV